jgi:site-specific DNA recombinase
MDRKGLPRRQRAVAVLRVSTSKQDVSLDVQLDAIRRVAESENAELVNVHVDKLSGDLYRAREGLQQAIGEVRAGSANLLIVYNLDRLSRKVGLTGQVAAEVERAGGRLLFADGTRYDHETPEDELNIHIRESFSSYEKQVIRRRTINALRKLAENGMQPGRRMHPYGYHVVTNREVARDDPRRGKYEIIPAEAEIVREIYRRYADGGSLWSIKRWLDGAGISSPGGDPTWDRSTLGRILQNPVYKGQAVYGRRKRVVDEAREERGLNRVVYAEQPEERWITIPCPALVDEGLWEVCHRRRQENRARLSGNGRRQHLLSGLLRCPQCGVGMGGHKKKYYACPEHCPGTLHRMDVVEPLVVDALQQLAAQPDQITAALRAYDAYRGRKNPRPDEGERLKRELNELADQERATVRAQIQAFRVGVNSRVYEEELGRLAARRAVVEARVSRWEQEAVVAEPATQAEAYARVMTAVREVLTASELSAQEKYERLSTVIARILPEPDGSYRLELRPAGDSVAHMNMCVLGRSFAIRQMTRWAIQCVLVRDLTDTMYNPRMRPFVSHDEGTALVVEHIERHWCPTTLSEEIVGG